MIGIVTAHENEADNEGDRADREMNQNTDGECEFHAENLASTDKEETPQEDQPEAGGRHAGLSVGGACGEENQKKAGGQKNSKRAGGIHDFFNDLAEVFHM